MILPGAMAAPSFEIIGRDPEREVIEALLDRPRPSVLVLDGASQAAGALARAFLDHPRVRDLLAHPERPDYEQRLRQEVQAMRQLVAGAGDWSFVAVARSKARLKLAAVTD